jgi:hypothetical protein
MVELPDLTGLLSEFDTPKEGVEKDEKRDGYFAKKPRK